MAHTARALTLALGVGLGFGPTLGCVVHRGPDWHRVDAPPPAEAAYSVVVIGNPGAPGRHARTVARKLDEVLAAERAAGRNATVLWLGDLVMSEHPDRHGCAEPSGAWSRQGSQELSAVVQRHVQAGGASYAVLGPTDRTCGLDQALRQADGNGPHPWSMPDDHYVVRIHDDGTSKVVSRCDATRCEVDPPSPSARLELVVADITVWTDPPTGGPAAARTKASQERLDRLVAAAVRDDGPPRVLVSAVPIEAAGLHGHGGRGFEATFHNLPPLLADAIVAGRFVGSVGAYDHALYATPDITDAIKRSDKAWVAAPLFQLVSGSASWPDARAAAADRRLRYFRGNAYRPPIYSDHAGFAVLHARGEALRAELWAHRRGHWETQPIALELTPAPHPAETPSPPMTPCLRCQEKPAPQR